MAAYDQTAAQKPPLSCGLNYSAGKHRSRLRWGIFDDLMQDIAVRGLAFGLRALRATLASYAQSPRYYRALVAGGVRYDLKGQPCGEVTPQEQQDAETRLMALNEKHKRQRKAMKEGKSA